VRGLLVAISIVAVGVGAAACDPVETRVGKARLPEADGTVAAPKGPTVVIPGDAPASSYQGPVRIAADRETPYRQVMSTADAVMQAGGVPVLVVASSDSSVRALPEPDAVDKLPIKLAAHAGDVKACISPPEVPEATCIARKDHLHIDRAFVRGIVRQAVDQYNLRAVRVVIDPDLSWADAVRAIDGARTCCFEKKVTVSVESETAAAAESMP
jgi:hypothetical protein